MLGGREEPCYPFLNYEKGRWTLPERRDETTGDLIRRARDCPRVELLEENVAILPLVRTLLSETIRPMAPLVAEAALKDPVTREARLARAIAAVQSKRVNDAIREDIKRKAEAKRKS